MRLTLLFTTVLLFSTQLNAEVRIDPMFGDHMVLQAEIPVNAWGTAFPGEKIKLSFNGQSKSAAAGKDGKWLIKLDPLKTGASGELIINETTFKDVLVGEVWLGCGQSNMAGGAAGYIKNDLNLNELVDTKYSKLRLYDRRESKWVLAEPTTSKRFSAIHFAFGAALHLSLKQPVGLMYGAVGNTASGRWITPEMADANEEVRKQFKKSTGFESVVEQQKVQAKEEKEYEVLKNKALAEGSKPPRMKRPIKAGDLFNEHIKKFVPYTIRGVLWDQGETKVHLGGIDQFTCMSALIGGWRHLWSQGDFHFLHIQKPSGGGCAWNYDNPITQNARPFAPLPEKHWPASLKYPMDHIRMTQIKNAPIVTATDLQGGVHPRNKSGYGKRASIVALGTAYKQDLVIRGPLYKSHKIEGDKIRISYDHLGQGLAFKHLNKIQGFEIAGADGTWEWADAAIDGDTVLVSHANVKEPSMVRYAFSKYSDFANLFNKDGWPAVMFCTESLK
jgi:sialate O-acetylesterase